MYVREADQDHMRVEVFLVRIHQQFENKNVFGNSTVFYVRTGRGMFGLINAFSLRRVKDVIRETLGIDGYDFVITTVRFAPMRCSS